MAHATIGVVGLGAMGLGIAELFAGAGMQVRATDQSPEMRASALTRMDAGLQRRVDRGRMTESERAGLLARIRLVDGPEGLAPCDLVIEAIVENFDAKAKVFTDLERVLPAESVVASNTSSLSITQLSERISRPERFIGLHFFNPPQVMTLVELVSHLATSEAARERAEVLAKAAGKTVIRCDDRPGFVVNRCARPFYGEAMAIVEEGIADPGAVDAAMVVAGYRLGPFSLIDLVGADINLAATEGVAAQMHHHPRYHVFDILRAQVARGHLGRKSGRGFIYPDPLPEAPDTAAAIVMRIEAALINEAASLLAEGGSSADDIDTALRLGLNFPRGPFEALRQHGVAKVTTTLEALEAAAPEHLKGRYRVQAPLAAAGG